MAVDVKEYRRAYYLKNKEKYRTVYGPKADVKRRGNPEHLARRRAAYSRVPSGRAKDLFLRYGITPSQYAELLTKQGGKCAICKSENSKRRNSKHLAVGHCHKTGTVRGLLCHSCNIGLGGFEDSFDSVLSAARYLQEFGNIL